MKKYFTKIIVIFLGALLVSCNGVQTIDITPVIKNIPTLTKEITPTWTVIPTSLSTVTATLTPTKTPFPTTVEQATIEAFGSLCVNSSYTLGSEISTDGRWIASTCISENGTEDSPLRVTNMDHSKDWKIYIRDYDQVYDHKSVLIPYRWSNDGKYLYVVSPTKISGCCWIGGNYVLLVRLNLETGDQIEILNGTDFGSDLPFSFTISENDRFLLFTPLHTQSYDFALLDLLTWETKTVALEPELANEIDLEFALMSTENTIILPLFKHVEFNHYKVETIGMINMATGKQTLLVSNLEPDKELYPIRWIDSDHVLLSSANPYDWYEQKSATFWLLNIRTAELVQTNRP